MSLTLTLDEAARNREKLYRALAPSKSPRPPKKSPRMSIERRWAEERREAERKLQQRLSRRFHSAKRRAMRLQRTPAWADWSAIKAVYAEAQALTLSTGIDHHVDHRYPLQGRTVSGLHVAGNLQILPAVENMRKHNRFEP